MLDLDSLRRIENRDQRYRTALEMFIEAKKEAGLRVEMELKGNGIDFQYAADVSGYSYAGFQSRLHGGLGFKPHAVVRLAYILLKESCHQLFFNERGVTELPRLESYLALLLMEASQSVRNEAYEMALRLFRRDQDANALYGQQDDSGLVRDRILELCADRNVQVIYLCGQDECQMSKICIRKFVTQEKPPYVPQTQVLMYYAFTLDTSLDYFMAPDYTPYSDVRLFGTCTDDIIRDALVVKTIGKFLVLSPESRRKFASYVLNQYWRS